MPLYTSISQVESILRKHDRKSDLSTVTFITPAENLVRRYCVPLGYDDETLELIARYLAAHFYTVTARRALDEWVGQARRRVEDKVSFGLDLTWYGQQAKLFDNLGGLTEIGKIPVGFSWLGDGEYERDYTK